MERWTEKSLCTAPAIQEGAIENGCGRGEEERGRKEEKSVLKDRAENKENIHREHSSQTTII